MEASSPTSPSSLDKDISENSMDVDLENSMGCRFPRRHTAKSRKVCAKEERNASLKKVSVILQKSEKERTFEESQMLRECMEEVEEVQSRWKKRDEAKRRLEEFEDSFDVLQEKCHILARAIAQSQHLVCYTGAGISTAARIPDYRGPNGIWTRLQQGKQIENHDLSLAEPTYTHMALSQLYHQNILKYVVSQNCDGLHLRSGLPRHALSELHGNMYVEVCKSCKPACEYWRCFDVTENTARYYHKTMRKCYICHEPLVDTIVHFGERGSLQWPLNWSGASKNAQKATTILCLGSSLKVLKKYPWLWQMDKPVKKRPNLYIVNLQWTPKDDSANVKINGKCDVVMRIVMSFLGISVDGYERRRDPIFYHATRLCEEEMHTTTQPMLKGSEVKMEEDTQHSFKSQLQSDSSDCDTSRNTPTSISYSNELENPAVVREDPVKKCSFSIDSILSNEPKVKEDENFNMYKNFTSNLFATTLLLPQNYQALVAYCKFTNALLLHNPLLSYQDMLYYPYQTSFLYSGIHNIINNALPNINFCKSELNHAKPDNNESEQSTKINHKTIVCRFCSSEFKSVSCLFYPKYKSVSCDKSSKRSACLCCDYSSEEEEEEDCKKEIKEEGDVADKDQKVKIQAGWFGKGYRKIVKKPKRKFRQE